MDFASTFFGDVFTEAIGWFLFHSVWQGALIAVLLFTICKILKKRSAQLRYYISYAALVLILFSASFTFQKAYAYAREKAQLKETIINNPTYLSNRFIDTQNVSEIVSTPKVKNNFRLERIKLRSGIQVYFPWIVSIWIIGLLIYLVRISGSFLFLYRLRTFQRIPIEPKWIKKTLDYCSRLKIKKTIGISLSLKIKTPITIGFIKPLILIPASLIGGLSPEMLEAIIVHELAHIRRNDYVMNILQTLIETLFFYHPGVWYISSQIRRERELACDDMALSITSDKVSYAKALTIAQENAFQPENFAMAFSTGKKTLLQRITRLNTKITMKANLFEKLTAGFLIISAFLFLSFIIDGNNTEVRERDTGNNHVVKSLSEPNPYIVILHKTDRDTSSSRKIVRRIHSTDKEGIDSLITILHAYGGPDDEVEKMIEIVLCEPDLIEYEEIMRSIHIALDEIDMAELERELSEAKKEMAEHAASIKYKNLIELEHLKECDSLNSVIMVSVKDAMEIAREELESLNLDSIVTKAMEEVNHSIKDLEIEYIIADAMEEARETLEEEHIKVIKIQKELEEKRMDLADREEILKEREMELKQQLKELEEQLKEVRQQQKDESKKIE